MRAGMPGHRGTGSRLGDDAQLRALQAQDLHVIAAVQPPGPRQRPTTDPGFCFDPIGPV